MSFPCLARQLVDLPDGRDAVPGPYIAEVLDNGSCMCNFWSIGSISNIYRLRRGMQGAFIRTSIYDQ